MKTKYFFDSFCVVYNVLYEIDFTYKKYVRFFKRRINERFINNAFGHFE